MLILGYVFAIRSERAICREVQVDLAYRWFCGLSIEDRVPDHSAFNEICFGGLLDRLSVSAVTRPFGSDELQPSTMGAADRVG
jgi:hypothetical protein